MTITMPAECPSHHWRSLHSADATQQVTPETGSRSNMQVASSSPAEVVPNSALPSVMFVSSRAGRLFLSAGPLIVVSSGATGRHARAHVKRPSDAERGQQQPLAAFTAPGSPEISRNIRHDMLGEMLVAAAFKGAWANGKGGRGWRGPENRSEGGRSRVARTGETPAREAGRFALPPSRGNVQPRRPVPAARERERSRARGTPGRVKTGG
jgi:hypothetical protein